MDESLIVEVWDIFKEYISDKNKDVAANQYVDFLLGQDISVSTLESYLGYDSFLDEAINTVIEEEKSYEEDEVDGYDDSDDGEY